MKSIVMAPLAGAVALLAGLTAVVTPAAAQQSTVGKVAYVNTREILQKTPGYATADSTFAKEGEVFNNEFRKIRESLDSAASDFERKSALLTAAQRDAKRKALEEQEQKANQRAQELREKMAARERELLQPIHERINAVIEGIRAAGGYAIIFDVGAPNSGVVTADRSLDLTAKVIQQLQPSK